MRVGRGVGVRMRRGERGGSEGGVRLGRGVGVRHGVRVGRGVG